MNIKNIVLGIGIFIVFMFLLHNGIRAFYTYPEYNDYCKPGMFMGPVIDKPLGIGENCNYTLELRQQEQQCYVDEGQPIYNYDNKGCSVSLKECSFCSRDYNNDLKEYNKNVFIIAIIAGILVLLSGYLILSVEPVGSALMASGIGAIIYGTIVNWENLGNLGRFFLLLFALLLLIWIAYRINKAGKKSWWKFW
jgi:hypothetical protein